jgi:hypothetical protein
MQMTYLKGASGSFEFRSTFQHGLLRTDDDLHAQGRGLNGLDAGFCFHDSQCDRHRITMLGRDVDVDVLNEVQ